MDTVSNILAQVVPAAITETAFYTVASTQKARLDEFVVCNRAGSASSFRISVSLTGAATAPTDYLYYDMPVNGNDTFANEMGITIPAGAVVRIYASSANLTFTLFGQQT